MSLIQYQKGDIFDQVIGGNTIIAHSCNCQGVWGAGFAASLASRFKEDFAIYKMMCRSIPKGSFILSPNILSLLTSTSYGRYVDHPDSILESTRSSLESFLMGNVGYNLHMPKINSGLFRVPWHKTELILEDLLTLYAGNGHNITVWEQ